MRNPKPEELRKGLLLRDSRGFDEIVLLKDRFWAKHLGPCWFLISIIPTPDEAGLINYEIDLNDWWSERTLCKSYVFLGGKK